MSKRIKLVDQQQGQDQLVELIETLNKAEKRYFKLLTGAFPGSKSYLELFIAIEKTGSLESKPVHKLLKGKSVRQISDIKRYLFNLIMRSLSIQNREDTIEKLIQNDIQHINLLFKRGMYKAAQSMINKNLKLAEEHNYHRFCYELKLQELNLLLYTSSYKEIDESFFEFKDYITDQIHAEKERISYQLLRFKWFSFIRQNEEVYYNPDSHHKLKDFMSNPMLSDENTPRSMQSKIIFYLINTIYSRISNQRDKQLIYAQKSVEFWKDYNTLISNGAMGYLSSLRNLTLAAAENNRVDIMKECRKKAKEVNASNMRQMKEIELITHILPMSYNNKMGLFEANETLFRMYDKEEPMYLNCMNISDKLSWYYELAYTAFGLKEYSTAIYWLTKTLNTTIRNFRLDVEAAANMMLLLAHFELGNYDVVKLLSVKIKRFLKSRELLGEFEKDFFKAFDIITNQAHKGVKGNELFAVIKSSLLIVEDQYKDRVITAVNDKSHVELFNFTAWIRSKTDGISLAEAIQQLKEPSQPFVLVD